MRSRSRSTLVVGCACVLLGACASEPTSPEVDIAPGEYPRAFAAAREVVRDHRFDVDRVDAAAGVIASDAKPTSGVFTPWDTEQSTFSQEMEDSINFQQRRVRVTFEPRDDQPANEPRTDLRGYTEGMICRFEVIVERIERPDRRVSARAVRLGTQAFDPELRARGMWPTYSVVSTLDPYLAGRLAGDLKKLMITPKTVAGDEGNDAPAAAQAADPSAADH